MTAPRIAPGNRRQAGTLAWAIAQVGGLQAGTRPLNLFLTIGRHRMLFRGWLRFAGRLMPRGTLPRRETELVILRVAQLCGCRYELDHHVRLGRRAGLTVADIERVVDGPERDGWPPREHALLAAVDMLHARHDLDDQTWSELIHHLDEPRAIEFCFLVGHYEMLATVIATLRIQPDPARRGCSRRTDPMLSARRGS